MLKQMLWLCQVPAVILAIMFFSAGAYFGSTNDFVTFLLSIPSLGLLFISAVAATLLAARIKHQIGRAVLASVLICLTPLAYICSYRVTQEARFLLWIPAHYDRFEQVSTKNGIVMDWDSWGMAGQDTDSYLVVDTQDQLESHSRADKWTKMIGQSCGVWSTQRVWPRFYVVTTYTNCPFEGVANAS